MKQKGQGIIEFALIVPLLIAVGVAVVYVGILFLDYTQYSNAARDAARDISVQSEVTNADESYTTAAEFRQSIVNAINSSGDEHDKIIARYSHPYTKILKATWSAQFYKLNSNKVLEKVTGSNAAKNADTIEVSIEVELADGVEGDERYMGKWLKALFKLPTIRYKMILE